MSATPLDAKFSQWREARDLNVAAALTPGAERAGSPMEGGANAAQALRSGSVRGLRQAES